MSQALTLACGRCGSVYPADMPIDSTGCPRCFSEAPANLRVIYRSDRSVGRLPPGGRPAPSLWRYAEKLPCRADQAVTLGEGLTPLVPAPNLGAMIRTPHLLIKNEGSNPTGSHKDRFSTVAVSAARGQGARVVATSSSGNAGASLAAYAGRAGLKCVVATFAGTAGPMVQQMHKYGATVVPFTNKTDRWKFLHEGVARAGWYAVSPFRAPVVGSHPLGIEGYKTLAFEIVDQMDGLVPDWCALPVCYGDALAGLWLGFKELHEEGVISRLPKLIAAEAHGSLMRALEGDGDLVPEVEATAKTLAVSVGATRSTFQALQALRESSGIALRIENHHLIDAQERLATHEGLFVELSSAMPLAAVEQLRARGSIRETDVVVAVVTAHGFKDLGLSADSGRHLEVAFGSTPAAWTHLRCSGEFAADTLR
jgi:threonine synthase